MSIPPPNYKFLEIILVENMTVQAFTVQSLLSFLSTIKRDHLVCYYIFHNISLFIFYYILPEDSLSAACIDTFCYSGNSML